MTHPRSPSRPSLAPHARGRVARETPDRHRQLAELTADLAFEFRVTAAGHCEPTWLQGPWQHITGFPEELLFRPEGWLALVEGDRREAMTSFFRDLVEGHPADTECCIRTRKGRPCWLRCRAVRTIRDGHAVIMGALWQIDEQKEREQDLIRAREKAEKMSRLKTIFLDNMSHEIRTPLASIIGFATILNEEVPERHRKFVSFIERSGKRLLDTLNAILSLSLMESGNLKMRPGILDVNQFLSDKAIQIGQRATEEGLDLTVSLPDAPVFARLDAEYLDKILDGLLSNAFKFTESGGITLKMTCDEAWVHVHVKDTGIGIGPEFLPRLFDEFEQESSGTGRRFEGIGLGLTITRRLVEMMGGRIDVESRPGAGSVFTVSFPCLRTVAYGPAPPGETASATSRPGHILVVEDSAEMLVLYRHFLRDVVSLETVGTAEEALERLAAGRFDMVVMDINLGGETSGSDVLRAMRTDPALKGIPVVAATAYALPGDREKLLASGFDGYLAKPFNRQALLETLAGVLSPAQA